MLVSVRVGIYTWLPSLLLKEGRTTNRCVLHSPCSLLFMPPSGFVKDLPLSTLLLTATSFCNCSEVSPQTRNYGYCVFSEPHSSSVPDISALPCQDGLWISPSVSLLSNVIIPSLKPVCHSERAAFRPTSWARLETCKILGFFL